MFKTENEANIIYNLRTSEDRLQQYERDKVQCRQSDERYLPIRKKKRNYALHTMLHTIVQRHKLGNSSWFISYLNIACLALNYSA